MFRRGHRGQSCTRSDDVPTMRCRIESLAGVVSGGAARSLGVLESKDGSSDLVGRRSQRNLGKRVAMRTLSTGIMTLQRFAKPLTIHAVVCSPVLTRRYASGVAYWSLWLTLPMSACAPSLMWTCSTRTSCEPPWRRRRSVSTAT
jgi:hypothetical protein